MPETSFSYAIPWLLLIIFYLFLGFVEYRYPSRKKINTETVCFVVYLFFFGLRGFVGWDYASYYPAYEDCPTLFDAGTISEKLEEFKWESGYVLYMIVCKTITPNYHIFIFISTLIDALVIKKLFERYSVNKGLSYALLVVFSVSMQLDLLRSMKALVLFLLALPYLQNRKPIPYFMLITVALTFHFSAIVFYPLYFFLQKQIPLKLLWGVFIVGNVVYFLNSFAFSNWLLEVSERLSFLSDIFLDRAEAYSSSVEEGTKWGLSFGFFERTATWLLLLTYYKKIGGENRQNLLFLNATVIYLSCYLLLSNFQEALQRFAYMFSFGYWLFYPLLLYKMRIIKGRRIASLLLYCMVGYCLIRGTMKNNIITRYENVLFSHADFYESMNRTADVREEQMLDNR